MKNNTHYLALLMILLIQAVSCTPTAMEAETDHPIQATHLTSQETGDDYGIEPDNERD